MCVSVAIHTHSHQANVCLEYQQNTKELFISFTLTSSHSFGELFITNINFRLYKYTLTITAIVYQW